MVKQVRGEQEEQREILGLLEQVLEETLPLLGVMVKQGLKTFQIIELKAPQEVQTVIRQDVILQVLVQVPQEVLRAQEVEIQEDK